jgi:hypothetical protein
MKILRDNQHDLWIQHPGTGDLFRCMTSAEYDDGERLEDLPLPEILEMWGPLEVFEMTEVIS